MATSSGVHTQESNIGDTLPQFENLVVEINARQDEYIVDFEEPEGHAVLRWGEIVSENAESLADSDHRFVLATRGWNVLDDYIRAQLTESVAMKRYFRQLQPVPRSIATLTVEFNRLLSPMRIDLNALWGLVHLNLTLSTTQEKLANTTDWLVKLRRSIERFFRAFQSYKEKQSDTRELVLIFIDVFELIMSILADGVKLLRRRHNPDDAISSGFVAKTNKRLEDIDEAIKHVVDLNNYSQAGLENQARNLTTRQFRVEDPVEAGRFPITTLPYKRNDNFYGRAEELETIDQALRWQGNLSLRTFSIYGRRGVGKTEIAQEYAYRNPSKFDAVFWVRCETRLTLRLSFTEIAMKLGLPGADLTGKDEENQMAVLNWLKTTQRRWLLVFDNADKESESNYEGYWPQGSEGAILITSRNTHNFNKDKNRKGRTIEPFQVDQAWELMNGIFDNEWAEASKHGRISDENVAGARKWLKELGGLPLSIATATKIINKTPYSNNAILKLYSRFLSHQSMLPQRHRAKRSDIVTALDATFDMALSDLKKNARTILSILALLSPDEIPTRLFLPRDQSVLDGKLQFAKQSAPVFVAGTEAALTGVTAITPALESAFQELLDASLIRREGNAVAIHREIQDAMNYTDKQELQISFEYAVRLVFHAFPKQKTYQTLFKEWKTCAAYITHATHLGKKYREYMTTESVASLKAPDEFTHLLCNAGWYLYEIGEFDISRTVIEHAVLSCKDKSSKRFADLCNVQGCNNYDLNRLGEARQNWETAFAIVEELGAGQLESTKSDLAALCCNLGNLESTAGNYDRAFEYFEKSRDLRLDIGDDAAGALGLTYLGMARLYNNEQKFSEARKFVAQAEQIYSQQTDGAAYFIACCHFVYGNVDFAEKLFSSARRFYELCLNLLERTVPVHPLIASAFYKLGCCEYEMGNYSKALGHLKQAQNIAEYRSPTRDDGTIARILWKTAQIMRRDPKTLTAGMKDVDELICRAETARAKLIESNEASEAETKLGRPEDDERTDEQVDEQTYDELVPGFYR